MNKTKRHPWFWVPSLYFAEGLPYIIVLQVTGIMYKNLGISNADISLYTGLAYLPWVIKSLWSPLIDLYKTKRTWIFLTQIVLGAGFAGIAFSIPAPAFFQYTIAFLWLMAFSSATHDIAADGFYILALSEHDQSWFVGIRNTFYRLALLAGQGPLVILVGQLEKSNNSFHYSWMIAFSLLAILFVLFSIYHFFILPKPAADKALLSDSKVSTAKEFFRAFITFFNRKKIAVIILFILLYRFGEAQLGKMASLFMLDPINKGGLGLGNEQIGWIYGTLGVIALVLGGILGGFVVSKNGLKFWLWPMVLALNVPDLVYVYLSYTQNTDLTIVSLMVIIEQFGYGFGFTAFSLYLIYICEGVHKTSHYAIATGIMGLGMWIPQMISGILQEAMGYKMFFVWVCLATIPGFILAKLLPLDTEFGKKTEQLEV